MIRSFDFRSDPAIEERETRVAYALASEPEVPTMISSGNDIKNALGSLCSRFVRLGCGGNGETVLRHGCGGAALGCIRYFLRRLSTTTKSQWDFCAALRGAMTASGTPIYPASASNMQFWSLASLYCPPHRPSPLYYFHIRPSDCLVLP